MHTYYAENPQMYVSVDCIIFGYEGECLKVLVQQRNFEPFIGELSLMGGFVQQDESIDEAARRIIKERTGLTNVFLAQVGAFGSLDRDTAARVVSICYFTVVNQLDCDNTLNEKYHGIWADVNNLPQLIFDHNEMAQQAHAQLQRRISYSPIAMGLLPQSFTLSQLQKLYEVIWGQEIDKRNFRKRIAEMPFIEETGEIDKTTSKRGARLFRFNDSVFKECKIFKL